MTDSETPSPAGGDSSLGRLAGVLFTPFSTFEKNARRPRWLVPLIATMVLTFVLFSVIGAMVDEVEFYENQLSKSGMNRQMTDEQIEEAVRGSARLMQLFRYVTPFVVPPAQLFLTGLLLWVFLLALGTDLRFMAVVSVLAYALFAYSLITTVLTIAVFALAEDPNTIDMANAVTSHLGFLVDPVGQPVLHRLLASVDLLVLYVFFLVGLGLSRMSPKVGLGVGMGSIAVLYCVYVGFVTGLTALFT